MSKYNNEQADRSFYESVEKMIKKYNMLDQCKNLIVGLSGGADSVCLLLVMQEYIKKNGLDIILHVIHVNHGIRGEEALRDQKFSQELCKRLNVHFVCEKADIPRLAKDNKQTEEEAGRNVRYSLFAKLAQTLPACKIAVAHHMNDQAETVVMNMFRGSSLRGMCGMLPVRDNIIRPLLGVTRADIEKYLRVYNQEYVTDQTNADTGYTRNRIRREVIPFLEEKVSAQAVRRVSELADSIQEVESFIQAKVDEAYSSCVSVTRANDIDTKTNLYISEEEFSKFDTVIKKGVIHKAIVCMSGAEKDIYKNNIEDVYELFALQVNKRRSLPYKLFAKRCYDGVVIGHADNENDMNADNVQVDSLPDTVIEIGSLIDSLDVGEQIRVPLEHMIYMREEGLTYISNIVILMQDSADFSLNNDYTKVFDYDKMKDNLVFRFRNKGDRIVVTSDGQSRKLKSELIDRKIPKESRNKVLLLASDSNVYWAVGVRRGEDCLIDSTTKRILRISFE